MMQGLRKSLSRSGLVLSLFCCAVGSQATTLTVNQHYQEMDQWCWAGVSQSILEYYGTSVTQTQIAAYGTEGANIWNWLWGSSTSPTRRGIDLILTNFASLGTTSYSRAFSLAESSTEIEARRPFVVRWGWDSGGGHFVAAKGVTGSTMELMDPWYGPTVNTYDWVARGSSHTWTHTLKMNSSPVVAYGLSVAKSGAGSGTVVSSPAGIDCGASCSANFANGATVALAATAAGGSTFAGWSGACTGTGACTVTMNAAKSVTASFVPASPDLIVSELTVSSTSGNSGQMIHIGSTTVANQGNGAADSSWVGFYLSADNAASADDVYTGWGCTVPALAAGGSYTCGGDIAIPGTLIGGTYYINARADVQSVVAESNEANNTRSSATVVQITGLPSPPIITTIAPSVRRLAVYFSPPANNGGSALVSYTATCVASGKPTRTATGGGAPLVVTALEGGVPYSCSVTATNGAGYTSVASPATSGLPKKAGGLPLMMLLE